ncbi:hypothetical protein BH10ACT9_BH10ACT9_27270 [soil metagenome]
MMSSGHTLAQRVGRWVPAVLLAGAGVVAGWLVLTVVLSLPLPEAVLFGIGGLAAVACVAGVIVSRRLLVRAFMVGGAVGTLGSLLLVALLVVG